MFACLLLQRGPVDSLLTLADSFAPHWERCDTQTLLIPAYGLDRLFGSPTDIAERIMYSAGELGLELTLAIATHPDTALLAARNIEGITIVDPGREVEILGPLPVDVLPATLDTIDIVRRWGVETLADFVNLPPLGIVERLGDEGARLLALVEGRGTRPLRIARPPEDYTAQLHLDEPLTNSEPLLFIVSGMVHDIAKRLASHGFAVGRFRGTLTPLHQIDIAFPVPVRDPLVILKQVQLDLEARPPSRAISTVTVELLPVAPQTAQHGLFTPTTPEPAQLQTLLARLRAIVGHGSVGSPELLDTHRPDAWQLRDDVLYQPGRITAPGGAAPAHLGFRRFRPPLPAQVTLDAGQRPIRVAARGIAGKVLSSAGPWRTTGDWWRETVWARDEWDIGLDNGALYRLYCEHGSHAWFVEGAYD